LLHGNFFASGVFFLPEKSINFTKISPFHNLLQISSMMTSFLE